MLQGTKEDELDLFNNLTTMGENKIIKRESYELLGV